MGGIECWRSQYRVHALSRSTGRPSNGFLTVSREHERRERGIDTYLRRSMRMSQLPDRKAFMDVINSIGAKALEI
jgi:hypothetical protein